MSLEVIEMSADEWREQGARLFGDDMDDWSFICPCCGHVASSKQYREAGDKGGMIGFSCIGRLLPNPREAFVKKGDNTPGPCNYAGGGLFCVSPILVKREDGKSFRMFAFAEPQP